MRQIQIYIAWVLNCFSFGNLITNAINHVTVLFKPHATWWWDALCTNFRSFCGQ